MKYRTGFVTNSSSSSYLVAFKEENRNRFVEAGSPALELYDHFLASVLKTAWVSKEELDEEFLDRYGESSHDTVESLFHDADWRRKEYERDLTKIQEGFAVAEIDVDKRNKALSELIKALHNGETFLVEELD